jgi:hypothetical protein
MIDDDKSAAVKRMLNHLSERKWDFANPSEADLAIEFFKLREAFVIEWDELGEMVNNCPNCGASDDHINPDPDEGGRCRDCCTICVSVAADNA